MADKRLEVDIVANDRASRPIKNLQSTIIRFVGAVSASLAALSAVVFPINSAREFERVLRDVQKTTGFLNEEIETLGGELLDLSRTVDTSATDLGRIAAAAGQLGLGEAGGQAILTFTQSIARAATTLDLTAEQAATSFAKIASIFNIPISQTEKLTSTINELSNTTTATADQLLDVVRRVGTVAGTFEDTAALAAQAIQLGLSPETAGTSLVKIFSNFESRADQFAESFGITVGEFLGKGAVERWKFYLTELSKLSDEEAAKLINKLSGSGRIFALVNKQVQDAKNGFDIFNQAQDDAATAFEEGTSALEEYQTISQSLDVQLKILRNNFTALATEIGLRLVPQLIESVKQLQEFLQTERAKIFFEALGSSLGTLITVFEKFVDVISNLGASNLVNLFQVTLGAILVGALKLVIKIINGAITKVGEFGVRTIQADKQAKAAGKSIGTTLFQAFGLVKKGSTEAGQAVERSSVAITNTTKTYKGATAALGQYVDATNLAVVANAKLAASTAQTRAGQAAGATGAAAGIGAASAIDQGAAQQRVTSLQQELNLLGQKKAEQFIIIKNAEKELAAIKVRATVTKQAARQFGRVTETSRTNLKLFLQESDAQKAVIASANQRLNVLRASGTELDSQLVTYRQIQATAQNTAFTALAGAGKGKRQLDLLGRSALFVQGGFNNASREAGRLSGTFQAVGRGAAAAINSLRALAPVVRVLGVAVRGLFAFFGGPIGVAITAFIFFGDTIISTLKNILGIVSDTEAQITEIIRIEARNRQGIINKQIADYRRLQRAIRQGTEVDTDVAEFDSAAPIAEIAQFAGKAAAQLDAYARAATGAATESQVLSARVRDLENESSALTAQFVLTDDAVSKGRITEQQKELAEEIDKVNEQIREAIANQLRYTEAARIAGEELVQSFTEPVRQVVALQRAYKEAEGAVARFELQAKKLASIDTEASVVAKLEGQSLVDVKAQLTEALGVDFGDLIGQPLADAVGKAIKNFESNVSDLKKEVQELGDEAVVAANALEPDDKAVVVAAKIFELEEETLNNIVAQQVATEEIVKAESDRRKFLRDNADEILAQKFAYDLILEQFEKTQKALEANRKAAEGIFDNTAAEARALTVELEKTKRSLDDILENREKELRVTKDISDLTDSIEGRTSTIADLEEQLANTSDVYQRNKLRAAIQEEKSRKSIEETLRFEREREQASSDLTDLLDKIPGLTAEARLAAAEGQVGPLQAIKDEIDQAIGDSEDILKDLADVTGTDGNFLFRKDEIRDFEDALTGTVGDYQDILPNINKLLKDSAQAAEREIADTIRQFTAQNQELVTNFNDLLKAFPGIAASLDVVRQAWERANQPLINAIESFGRQTQAGILAGRGLGENIQAQVNDQLNAAVIAAKRPGNIASSKLYGDAITAALAGADLSQYKANVEKAQTEATLDGVNAITTDGIPGYSKIIRDSTEQAVLDALKAIDAGEELLTRPAPASEAIAQSTEQAAAELEGAPTQQVIEQVAKEAEARIEEGTAKGTAQGAKKGLEDPLTTAAAFALGDEVGEGAAFGFRVAGPLGVAVGGLAALFVDTVKKGIEAATAPTGGARLLRGEGLAAGGPVRGPGTGTSDSIPAWLSRGEYVSDARTVGHFGEGFFAYLKKAARGQANFNKRFKQGIPAFASGGLVGNQNVGMSNVHIHMPGGDSFALIGDNDTVGAMQRAMSREALRRGRKR